MKQGHIRKAGLLFLILVTAAAPAFFIRLNEATALLNLLKLLAKIGSLCGTVLLFWQFLLGYRRAVARWVTTDYLWVIQFHRQLGIGAFFLILLHPLLIIPYYRIKLDLQPLFGPLPAPLNLFVPLGIAAFALLLLILITSTAVLKSRLAHRTWYGFHLTSYAILPLAILHGFPIGMTLRETALRQGWIFLSVLIGLFFVLRVLGRFGVFDSLYETVEVAPEGEGTVEITMRPVSRPLKPGSAQFAFFRRRAFEPARPFTVSKYEEKTGEIGITVKAAGRISTRFQTVKPGERFRVDGPYGVFGREAFQTTRPVVMLAGGIGVTPFRRLIAELEKLPDREAYLFYGNQNAENIAHREEIENAEHVDVIHVLSKAPMHEECETGFITIDLLRKYLDGKLSRYEFFLCGPPVMVEKLEAALRADAVPEEQIHHELFSF